MFLSQVFGMRGAFWHLLLPFFSRFPRGFLATELPPRSLGGNCTRSKDTGRGGRCGFSPPPMSLNSVLAGRFGLLASGGSTGQKPPGMCFFRGFFFRFCSFGMKKHLNLKKKKKNYLPCSCILDKMLLYMIHPVYYKHHHIYHSISLKATAK